MGGEIRESGVVEVMRTGKNKPWSGYERSCPVRLELYRLY